MEKHYAIKHSDDTYLALDGGKAPITENDKIKFFSSYLAAEQYKGKMQVEGQVVSTHDMLTHIMADIIKCLEKE